MKFRARARRRVLESMDYLIAGLVVGSVLAIGGYASRELSELLPERVPAWLHDVGTTLMLAGVVVWLVAAAALAADLDDGTATSIVIATALIGILAGASVGWIERRHSLLIAPEAVLAANNGSELHSEIAVAFDQPDVETEANSIHLQEQMAAPPDRSSSAPVDWLATWSAVMAPLPEDEEVDDLEPGTDLPIPDEEFVSDAEPATARPHIPDDELPLEEIDEIDTDKFDPELDHDDDLETRSELPEEPGVDGEALPSDSADQLTGQDGGDSHSVSSESPLNGDAGLADDIGEPDRLTDRSDRRH